MYNAQITIIILIAPIIIGVIAYGLFPRITKNVLCKFIPAWNKRYVVCHMTYQAGMRNVFHIIPNHSGLTQVGKYSYNLSEKYAVLVHAKRFHFILDENDVIPRNFEPQTKDTITYQAAEIQTALDNNVMEYLFSKKKELLIFGLFILGIISVLAIVYNIYELNAIKAVLESQNSNIVISGVKP